MQRMVLCGVLLSLGFGDYLVATAWGQARRSGASSGPVLKTSDEYRALFDAKRSAIMSSNFGDAQKAALRNYYERHIFQGMTSDVARQDPQLYPDWRREILRDLTDNNVIGDAAKHRELVAIVYQECFKILRDAKNTPAARYNAVLLLGELNEREIMRQGIDFLPPVPLEPARKLLLQVLNSRMPDSMKVGALIGLTRHARALAAAGQSDAELLKAMVNVVRQSEVPADGTEDGLRWMQRLAIDALGDIGDPRAEALIEPFVSDESLPMYLRCTAADALGRLQYGRLENDKLKKMAQTFASLAAAGVEAQIAGLETHLKEFPPESGGRLAMATTEGGAEQPKQPEHWYAQQVRRELAYELEAIKRGLTGLPMSTADASAKSVVSGVSNMVQELIRALEDDQQTPQQLLDRLTPLASRFKNAAGLASR